MTRKFLSPPLALTLLFPLWIALPMSGAENSPTTAAPAVASAPTNPNNLGSDANGNPLRRAPRTGHISNYDEAKVGHYTLPDPLVSANGERVTQADTWARGRRPEILNLYQTEIFGRVPSAAPRVRFENVLSETISLNGTQALHRHAIVHIGEGASALKVNVHTYLPPSSSKPVPVLLHVTFATNTATPPTTPPTEGPPNRPSEAGPVVDMLGRGFGYALVRYTEIQPDNATTHASGLQALSYAPGQTKPADDEWGTIATWSWGLSRVLDYLATDAAVDAQRVAVIGHSRLGKTALWAGASDPRFALIFSSCAGEMGSALARRDFGESLDDMAGNFGWQFAGNLQKYPGHWNELPVDAHMLIALCAPRPVFITGGTKDQWADPKGEFLAEVAAAPVYELLGKRGLGITELPALDTPVIDGDLGFHYHTGGHTITPSDWTAFLTFAARHLKP
ncbi:MAG: acetylxylan esterase [Opitutaceae bacterium]